MRPDKIVAAEEKGIAAPGELFHVLSSPLSSLPFPYSFLHGRDGHSTLLPELQYLFIIVTLPERGR
jgi:hypothetical protein